MCSAYKNPYKIWVLYYYKIRYHLDCQRQILFLCFSLVLKGCVTVDSPRSVNYSLNIIHFRTSSRLKFKTVSHMPAFWHSCTYQLSKLVVENGPDEVSELFTEKPSINSECYFSSAYLADLLSWWLGQMQDYIVLPSLEVLVVIRFPWHISLV